MHLELSALVALVHLELLVAPEPSALQAVLHQDSRLAPEYLEQEPDSEALGGVARWDRACRLCPLQAALESQCLVHLP